jgi:cyclophilin family peptidyl-prolyl cis-trans isomerase
MCSQVLQVAPKTASHIMKLFQLGCYNSNHFFRVDRGFVAQTADVVSGRLVPLSPIQQGEAAVTVPLEVTPDVRHTEGVLSMARTSDPNSGGSSFSILLGSAPHLDMQYTIFGYACQASPWQISIRFCACHPDVWVESCAGSERSQCSAIDT